MCNRSATTLDIGHEWTLAQDFRTFRCFVTFVRS
jgi:hypothetical protein